MDNLTQGQEAAAKKKKKEDWYDMYKESERRRRKMRMRDNEIKKVVKAINVKKSPSSSSSSSLSTISLSTAKSSVDSRVGGKKNASFKMDDDNNIHDGEGGVADACMRASLSVRHFIEYFIC